MWLWWRRFKTRNDCCKNTVKNRATQEKKYTKKLCASTCISGVNNEICLQFVTLELETSTHSGNCMFCFNIFYYFFLGGDDFHTTMIKAPGKSTKLRWLVACSNNHICTHIITTVKRLIKYIILIYNTHVIILSCTYC